MENVINLILPLLLIGMCYFLLFRPQTKKKKEEDSMRSNLKIGDEITTIGGIIGKIVSIKDDIDSLVIETSVDRSKVLVRRWAIASCNISAEPAVKS